MRGPGGAGGSGVEAELVVYHRFNAGHYHWHVLGETASHDGVESHLFGGYGNSADGDDANNVVGFQVDGVEELGDAVGGGGYYGQAVGEALVEVKLDGFKIVESLMGVGCKAVLPLHMHGSADTIITPGGGGSDADAGIAK